MIWRLPHPVRGILAFLWVGAGGVMLSGFGLGAPELVVLTVVATGAFVLVSRGPARERAPSR